MSAGCIDCFIVFDSLTLALSPNRSWAVCLKLMSSGTVCVTMVTNSSTLPYSFTFFCRMTCHMYE